MTTALDAVTVHRGGTAALRDVTIRAEPGEVTMIVGGDGAGKTTLLGTLVGLTVPDTGRIRRPPPDRVGYLPTGAGSWRSLTIDENIEFVGGAYGLNSAEIADRSSALLKRANLDGARDRLAGDLSGGMRNKLGFCLAMLSNPDLIVLDEPTTGVDPVSRVELWRLISETAARGATVVMATTYMDEAERGSMVYLLERGQVLLSGAPADLVRSMPGQITDVATPVNSANAWRVGPTFHEWWPEGAPEGGTTVDVSLEDVAIVARLGATVSSGRAT